MGGAGNVPETRFGRFTINDTFDGLGSKGGTLLQRQTLGNWTNKNGTLCNVPLETVPPEATVQAGRLPTPLFGLGLVDAMPDAFLLALADGGPADRPGT